MRRTYDVVMDRYARVDEVAVRDGTGAGDGERSLTQRRPDLAKAVERLLDDTRQGDPESPLRWSCCSMAVLTERLHAQGRTANTSLVSRLLHELGYSLRSNRQTRDGRRVFDREAQLRHIGRRVVDFQGDGQPAIWVDTRKQLIGPYRIGGLRWRSRELPEPMRIRDFADGGSGEALLAEVEDRVKGWVDVGIDQDTVELAAQIVDHWWRKMGRKAYPGASRMLLTTDCGGAASEVNRVWKIELQRLADRHGVVVSMCHFPPATSRWRRIEHRMSARVVENDRSRPAVSREAIVNLLGDAPKRPSFPRRAGSGHAGAKRITDDQLEALALVPDGFIGQWNYCVSPSP